MTIKVFHCSDLHYCPKFLKWVDLAFTAAVDKAIAEDCQLAVIAGDSFDSSMGIHEPAYTAYLVQVMRIAQHMPVVVLQGTFSHDRQGCLDPLKSIPTEYPILVADEPGQWVLSKDGGGARYIFNKYLPADVYETSTALISVLPSLNKADSAIMEVGANEYVKNVMLEFATANEKASALDIPTILVSHGTVNGCMTESNHAMVSQDHEFDQETLFSSKADAVMLGHIHKRQQWDSDYGQIIAYPGSIARLVHGHHDPVGYYIWDMDACQVTPHFHESPSRQLYEIEYDGPPDMAELEELAAKATDTDAVRVRWTIDTEHAHSVDKKAILALFAHADSIQIEPTVNRIQSVRSPGISRALSIGEQMGYWATTTGDEENLPGMLGALQQLESMDVDKIVEGVVG